MGLLCWESGDDARVRACVEQGCREARGEVCVRAGHVGPCGQDLRLWRLLFQSWEGVERSGVRRARVETQVALAEAPRPRQGGGGWCGREQQWEPGSVCFRPRAESTADGLRGGGTSACLVCAPGSGCVLFTLRDGRGAGRRVRGDVSSLAFLIALMLLSLNW